MEITDNFLVLFVSVGALLVMFAGLSMIFKRLKAKKLGFGPATLKAIGVVLFIPTLLILAVFAKFQPETLAALLGTVAGYVLSHGRSDS